jgi:hypothetical protein
VNKLAVQLTFDEIAGAYFEEEDPRSGFGPVRWIKSDYKTRVIVTQALDAFSHMPWDERMRWCDVADLDVLYQGDTLPSMGSKEIMVGHGHHSMLVGTAYDTIMAGYWQH